VYAHQYSKSPKKAYGVQDSDRTTKKGGKRGEEKEKGGWNRGQEKRGGSLGSKTLLSQERKKNPDPKRLMLTRKQWGAGSHRAVPFG